jgi:hypothetical protein
MIDNPTAEELTKQMENNSELFCRFIAEIVKNKQAWSIDDSKQFVEGMIAQSAIQSQNLFNSFVLLNNTKNIKEADTNLDYWLSCLMESTVANLVLAFSLVDLEQEQSKTAFYTLVYEFLNLAAMGNKPTLH